MIIIIDNKYSFSTSWSYAKYFDEFRKVILSNFSNVEVFGQEYPIGVFRSTLSRLVSLLQYSLIAVSIFGTSIRNYITFIPEEWINKLIENKTYAFVGYIVINLFQNMITSSGAFEMYLGDQLVIFFLLLYLFYF